MATVSIVPAVVMAGAVSNIVTTVVPAEIVVEKTHTHVERSSHLTAKLTHIIYNSLVGESKGVLNRFIEIP